MFLQRPCQWYGRLVTCRRTLSTSCETKDALRKILRETAQPVAVVTSYYPFDGAASDSNTELPHFHGATLSSFTSIALDPHPLVAFSLRIPSRMAASLKALMEQKTPSLVVNILADTQADTAIRFSRADLYPEPFRITPHSLSSDGLPVITGSLGALSCSLVSCLPLHNLCEDEGTQTDKGVISELFISRVHRVESIKHTQAMPLLYYDKQYATVQRLVDGQAKCNSNSSQAVRYPRLTVMNLVELQLAQTYDKYNNC